MDSSSGSLLPNTRVEMLLVLIPVAWLAIVVLLIAVCAAAARGDAKPARVVETSGTTLRPRLLVREEVRTPIRLRRPDRRPVLQDASRVRNRRLVHSAR